MSTTPKAVLQAFFPERVSALGLELRPVSLAHWLALQKIGSPFAGNKKDRELIEVEVDGKKIAVAVPTEEDVATAAVVLSLAPLDALARVRAGTLGGLVDEFCAKLPAGDIRGAMRLIDRHIAAAFNTAIPTASNSTEAGEDGPLAGSAGS